MKYSDYIIWIGLMAFFITIAWKLNPSSASMARVVVIPSRAVVATPLLSERDFCTLDTISCGEVIRATIYGYSSSVDETDSTPFITASQQKVRKGIVANNCLDFGQKVEIDNKVYEVQDRMNKRYTKCGENDIWVFDIWFEHKVEAINFGKKNIIVKSITN